MCVALGNSRLVGCSANWGRLGSFATSVWLARMLVSLVLDACYSHGVSLAIYQGVGRGLGSGSFLIATG